MRKVQIPLLLAIAVLASVFLSGAEQAAAKRKQAIIVFIEGLSFSDFAQLRNYPHVNTFLKQGWVGALTVRTPGPRTEANVYLQLGSGGQALHSERSGTVYQADERLETGETAAERMAWAGGSGAGKGGTSPIVFPGIFRLHAENADKPFTARIGLLGTTLAAHGLAAASYGNGDYEKVRQRYAGLVAVDKQGIIAGGDVSARSNLKAADYPYGIRTDYAYIISQLEADKKSAVITVQLADLSRLYRLRDDMAPGHFHRQHSRILADLDMFIGRLVSGKTPEQMILVMSPLVNETAAKEKSLLTPIMLWKEGDDGGRLLTSATTRQNGLVSGLDVLPTVLSWLSLPLPADLAGHVMTRAAETSGGADRLLADVSQIDHVYRNRSSVMYAFVMLQIIILTAAAAVWLGKKNAFAAERVRRGISLALLAMLFFPVLFLLEPLLSWTVSPPVVLGIIIMASLGGALIVNQWSFPAILLAVSGLTAAAILLDGFSGAEAMRRSYLGYDPVIGARFYGLGNEYEGVLIGSSIIFAASLYEWRKPAADREKRSLLDLRVWAAVLIFSVVLFYMAAPSLGTNAGGFLAGTVGFGVTLFRLQGWKVGKKGLLFVAGGILSGIGLLIAVNLFSSYPLTHVGRVAQEIVSGNWTEVAKIVERKLEMNLRLIRISLWSKVFAISLIVISLLSLHSDRFLRHLSSSYPSIAGGFHGVIAGSVAGLLLNDSGIVSAATSIIFFAVPALYAALGESRGQGYST
jgi:hypothetical protein